MSWKPPGLILALSLVTGCNVLPEPPPAPERFDLGTVSAPAAPAGAAAELARVTAPSWLATSEIAYRPVYRNPNARRYYAQHAWVAPPSELLSERLRTRLYAAAASRDAQAPRLRIQLAAFEQVFEAPGEAHALVRLRATLAPEAGERLRRSFTARAPTAPNAAGAIEGLTAAAERALDDLLGWVAKRGPG